MKRSSRRTRAALAAVHGISTELLESGALFDALLLAADAVTLIDAAEILNRDAVRQLVTVTRHPRKP